MKAASALVVALTAMTGLSQFHRAALGVIAPDLTADLGLTPAVLGAANGMFPRATNATSPGMTQSGSLRPSTVVTRRAASGFTSRWTMCRNAKPA